MGNTLQHIGVLGMHWGRRSGGKKSKSVPRHSADYRKVNRLRKKPISQMSNDEIRTLTNRMQLERQHKDLNPSKLVRGKKICQEILAVAGMVTAGVALGKTFYGAYAKVAANSQVNAKLAKEMAARLASVT